MLEAKRRKHDVNPKKLREKARQEAGNAHTEMLLQQMISVEEEREDWDCDELDN